MRGTGEAGKALPLLRRDTNAERDGALAQLVARDHFAMLVDPICQRTVLGTDLDGDGRARAIESLLDLGA